MSKARIYARNLAATWVGYGVNLVIMFLLSPYVVHRLGDVRYGVWSVLMSLTGYMGLVELGTRAALGRHINYYLGADDVPKVNGVINSALAMFTGATGLVLLVAGILSLYVQEIFSAVPAEYETRAQIVLVLVAVNLSISLYSAVFRQILAGWDRFEIINAIDLGVLLLRSAGTVAVLAVGEGLVALAAVHVSSGLLGLGATYLIARRVFPALRLRPGLVAESHFRELFGYGLWAFLGNTAMRLLYTTDVIVIGILMAPERVTMYSIGGMLLLRARPLMKAITAVFMPTMVKACARNDLPELRRLVGHVSRLKVLVGVPLLGGLLLYGREFLVLWMGPEYEEAYEILRILTFAFLIAMISGGLSPVFAGLNKVRVSASLALAQGVANLGLTLFFVMYMNMGIAGVAWGTFYPRAVFEMVGLVLGLRYIRMSVPRFLLAIVPLWVGLGAAFTATALGLRYLIGQGSWGGFFSRVALSLVLYAPLAWFFVLTADQRRRLTAGAAGAWRRTLGKRQGNPVPDAEVNE